MWNGSGAAVAIRITSKAFVAAGSFAGACGIAGHGSIPVASDGDSTKDATADNVLTLSNAAVSALSSERTSLSYSVIAMYSLEQSATARRNWRTLSKDAMSRGSAVSTYAKFS